MVKRGFIYITLHVPHRTNYRSSLVCSMNETPLAHEHLQAHETRLSPSTSRAGTSMRLEFAHSSCHWLKLHAIRKQQTLSYRMYEFTTGEPRDYTSPAHPHILPSLNPGRFESWTGFIRAASRVEFSTDESRIRINPVQCSNDETEFFFCNHTRYIWNGLRLAVVYYNFVSGFLTLCNVNTSISRS